MKKRFLTLIFAISVIIAFGFTVNTEAPAPADYVYTLTIASDDVPEMINVFGRGYEAQIEVDGELVANPQTKAQYAASQFDGKVKAMIDREVIRYRKSQLSVDNSSIVR